MPGHAHNPTAGTQNQGNSLGDRSCVRQSKLYRMYESGNGVKDILGSSHLTWDTNEKQGAYKGQKVYDHTAVDPFRTTTNDYGGRSGGRDSYGASSGSGSYKQDSYGSSSYTTNSNDYGSAARGSAGGSKYDSYGGSNDNYGSGGYGGSSYDNAGYGSSKGSNKGTSLSNYSNGRNSGGHDSGARQVNGSVSSGNTLANYHHESNNLAGGPIVSSYQAEYAANGDRAGFRRDSGRNSRRDDSGNYGNSSYGIANDENNNRARNQYREPAGGADDSYPMNKMSSGRNLSAGSNNSYQNIRARSSEQTAERVAKSYFSGGSNPNEKSTRPW